MIADELLNLTARLLLRAFPLPVAQRMLAGVGRLLPQRRTRQEVHRAASELGGRGTCLSRALAIAARAPAAEVVIGVQLEAGSRLLAHAWLEVDGVPLDPLDPSGGEIARLPAARACRPSP
jgi:hypothetical protein